MTWAASAAKHGVLQEDALHAIGNAVYVELHFDEPRPPSTVRPHLYIGPQRDPGAPLLEVMVEVRPPRGLHATSCQPAPSTWHGSIRRRPDMAGEQDYQAAADWAEHEMVLAADSPTALRGAAAARHGREALERALGGRPSIDPTAGPGQHARKRQVRLPADVDRHLDALASAQHRSVSEVMRDALADYLRAHPVT